MKVGRCFHFGGNFFQGPSSFFSSNLLVLGVSRYFSLWQNITVSGLGIKTFLSSPRKISFPSKHSKIIESIQKNFSKIYGMTYVTVGVLGALEAMNQYKWIALGCALPAISFAAKGLFLYGCLFAIEQHITLYNKAEKLDSNAAKGIRTTSILGIINSVAYIFSLFCSLYPPLQALSLLFACLAIFAGALNIILPWGMS